MSKCKAFTLMKSPSLKAKIKHCNIVIFWTVLHQLHWRQPPNKRNMLTRCTLLVFVVFFPNQASSGQQGNPDPPQTAGQQLVSPAIRPPIGLPAPLCLACSIQKAKPICCSDWDRFTNICLVSTRERVQQNQWETISNILSLVIAWSTVPQTWH